MIDTDAPVQRSLRDQFLVLRCQAGDPQAFAELFNRFQERTRLYLVRLLGGTEAQDVQNLTAPLREAVHLRYWEGLSYAEIALVTGQPIGTVRSRLHHARKRLLCALGPHHDQESGTRENQDRGASR